MPPKLSTGCGEEIDCDTHPGKVTLNPSKMNIEVFFTDVWPGPKYSAAWNASKVAQGWSKGQVITAYVWISNATKLYDIDFLLRWNTTLLKVDLQQITINDEAFPMPWSYLSQCVGEDGTSDYFRFIIERPHLPTKPPIKGTFWIVKLDFKVKCVTNGTYPGTDHKNDYPVPASTDIWIGRAIFSTCCGPYDSRLSQIDVSDAKYFWTPIPYDFDQNGHVGVEDILWIFAHYGDTSPPCSYDISGPLGTPDGVVDIYDVVIVSKAYCNSTPPDMPEDP